MSEKEKNQAWANNRNDWSELLQRQDEGNDGGQNGTIAL